LKLLIDTINEGEAAAQESQFPHQVKMYRKAGRPPRTTLQEEEPEVVKRNRRSAND
jgi:hypothetical protein